MSLAITREVSSTIGNCELTHLDREPIDLSRARDQHAAYCALLESLGLEVVRLPELVNCPDAVFVEDTALVLPELAVLTRPGAPSRRDEVPSIAAALSPHRELAHVREGSLDGGDILCLGRRLFVGLSERSNPRAIEELADLLQPRGYRVQGLKISGCLHLKTAVSVLDEETILIHPDWVDSRYFPHCRQIEIDPCEAFAGNALRIGSSVVHAEEFTRTRERLEAGGFTVASVPADELGKAEGGVTCCSLIL